MPHPRYVAVRQIPPSPGKKEGQMPGVCPGGVGGGMRDVRVSNWSVHWCDHQLYLSSQYGHRTRWMDKDKWILSIMSRIDRWFEKRPGHFHRKKSTFEDFCDVSLWDIVRRLQFRDGVSRGFWAYGIHVALDISFIGCISGPQWVRAAVARDVQTILTAPALERGLRQLDTLTADSAAFPAAGRHTAHGSTRELQLALFGSGCDRCPLSTRPGSVGSRWRVACVVLLWWRV